jgi:hypothetical protein
MNNSLSTNTSCLLSIPEVAWLLGIDNSQICRAIRVGLLPVVRRRGRVLVPAHAVAYLADSAVSGADSQVGPVVRGDA